MVWRVGISFLLFSLQHLQGSTIFVFDSSCFSSFLPVFISFQRMLLSIVEGSCMSRLSCRYPLRKNGQVASFTLLSYSTIIPNNTKCSVCTISLLVRSLVTTELLPLSTIEESAWTLGVLDADGQKERFNPFWNPEIASKPSSGVIIHEEREHRALRVVRSCRALCRATPSIVTWRPVLYDII